MKKLLLGAFVAALCLGGGFALSQTITKSLQGSQFSNGPVGLDASNNAYFPSHINPYGNPGGTAITGACQGPGGCSTAIAGTDNAFTIGTSGTSTTITFGQAFNQTPACVLQEEAGSTAPTFTVATTGILVTTNVTAKTYSGLCFSQD